MLDDFVNEVRAIRQEGVGVDFSTKQLAMLGLFLFLGLYAALVAAHYTTK